MKRKAAKIVLWISALLPVALLAVLYGALPAQVPTNWGLDGGVTYSGKATLWLVTLLSPGLAVLFQVLPHIDPRKRNYEKFRGYYDGFCLMMMFFLLALDAVILVESFRPGTISVSRVCMLAVGVLFAVMGNMLPKVKSNFFMGIKNPWTLSDPDVWNRTNRLGGILMFAVGALLIPCGLLLPEKAAFILLFAGLAAAVLIPTILSYIWYRQKGTEEVDRGKER